MSSSVESEEKKIINEAAEHSDHEEKKAVKKGPHTKMHTFVKSREKKFRSLTKRQRRRQLIIAVDLLLILLVLCIGTVIRQVNKDEGEPLRLNLDQTIEAHDTITKLKGAEPFNIDAKAKSKLTYSIDNESVATVGAEDGIVTIVSPGTASITVSAGQNAFYKATERTIKLIVLDSDPVKSGGASVELIYTLDESNCTRLFAVPGDGGVNVPQSFGYSGDKYYIAYCNSKGSSTQKVITFSSSGEKLNVVTTSTLGHPNGFAYCDSTGMCYALRGNGTRVDIYDPETDEFTTTKLPIGAAGIAYDRKNDVMVATSSQAVYVYSADGKFTRISSQSNCSHSGHVYTQDAGAHAGLVFRCMSGSNKHGTNYVDIYRTSDGTYLGSFEVHLGEVESAIVDNDGYLELLVNSAGNDDYIWKTEINAEDMAS